MDTNTSSSVTSQTSSSAKKCDQCEYSNDTEIGLNQHIRMKHKIAQIDGLEDSDPESTNESDVKSKTGKANVKETEVLTDPSDVTVAVKKVSKITVKDSPEEGIDNELEMFWESISINAFRVKPEPKTWLQTLGSNNFSVEISCWEFSKDFTATSAASLLESLPWPDGFSVTSSEPTTYLAKKP